MKFQVEINCLVSTIENTHDGNGKIQSTALYVGVDDWK
jgi:hypothetical protein